MKLLSATLLFSLVSAGFAAPFSNGGFEEPETKKKAKHYSATQYHAANWSFIRNSGNDCDANVTVQNARTGKTAARLTTKKAKAFPGIYQTFDCQADSEMTVSAWMKRGEARAVVFFRIFFIDGQGKKNMVKYLMHGWNLSKDWKKYEYKFKIPSYAKQMTLCIETMNNKAPEIEILIDDVAVSSQSGTVLKNAMIRAEIDPLFGGCIRSLTVDLKNKKIEFTKPRTLNTNGGMALEIIPAKRNPGLFANKKYDFQVIIPQEKISLTRTEKGATLNGLTVRKTFTLPKDSTQIQVDLELSNTGKKKLQTTCRIHNVLLPVNGAITIPVRDWLQCFKRNETSIETTNTIQADNLKSGWLSKSMPDATLIGQFSLSQFKNGYFWVGSEVDTMEWFYLPITLAPGESWKTSYFLNIVASNTPVFAFDGKTAFSVDSLEKDAAKNIMLAANSNVSKQYTINGKEQKLQLSAGNVITQKLSTPNALCTAPGFHAMFGTENNYKAEFIRGIKLPTPKEQKKLDGFDDFFVFCYNADLALTYKESTGVTGYAEQFIRNAENTIRESAANGCNMLTLQRVPQPQILPFTKLKNGKNLLGELARKYDIYYMPNTLIIWKDDIDIAQFRPRLQKRLDFFYHPYYLDVIKQYKDRFKAVYTADEITAQNIPCMLEAHEKLTERLPVKLPVYPMLNLHTRAYLPYVSLYSGDWYPINRKENGGRNPWSMERVVKETVDMAKGGRIELVIQTFGFSRTSYSFPTPAEIRLMSHLAVANGAKGISYHEVTNGGLIWRYNYGYHYTARGNAGELTPLWFALGECGRELTAIGPEILTSKPSDTQWITVSTPHYRSSNGYYNGPQVKPYSLERQDHAKIVILVNQDVKKNGSADIKFNLKKGEKVYSLTEMAWCPSNVKITLKPGNAEYFAIGTETQLNQIHNAVALKRFQRAVVEFRIQAERAERNGVDLAQAVALEMDAKKFAEAGKGMEAWKKINLAKMKIEELIKDTDYGNFQQKWWKFRMALSDISFKFQTHFDLVIPPHLRKKTKQFAKWNNTEDPQMQKLVDNIAAYWTEYWRIEYKIVNGALKEEYSNANKLIEKGLNNVKETDDYLKKNAHKINVDDPFAD
ncbi:MAG: hypothetical protein J6W00_07510 [Lentisphaeria bacterium]|nr:hypothetical protein [Lentisphaeria bacterium]